MPAQMLCKAFGQIRFSATCKTYSNHYFERLVENTAVTRVLGDSAFDTLEFHDRCETVARERQSLLHATTSADAQVGIAHQELVTCLYVAFPVAYPVLSTAVRVEQVCEECQRAIRDHLVRRA